jgi:uncharacterized protein
LTLVDANLLLYAVDRTSPFHTRSAAWLTDTLNGSARVGIPWQSLVAFLRISTHPRASAQPLTSHEALAFVHDWLAVETVWTPEPVPQHERILSELIEALDLRANLISDAHLAAIAIGHGLTMFSADSDFARFPGLAWRNPLA